ncbi:hypothetical protein ncot_11195 [Nocardioides sp. JQ2195]|uniref:hypothetical protein n=1 Tax=Nocardioides sp. JQ2195 TaxID=2592334 RepID=UPI00143E6C84|nr:hypothetical protein [Nocardioides sp. JQ2195]QIX27096.1 hypothetical protein ncot_11195 [Nocardioides sp. JQ2195]
MTDPKTTGADTTGADSTGTQSTGSDRAGTDRTSGASRWLPALIAIISVVAVVALVAGVKLIGDDDPGDSRVDGTPSGTFGKVMKGAAAAEPLTNEGEVVLPWIRLDVAAGEPVDEIPATKKQAAVAAPAGGSFIRVEVSKQGTVAFALSSKSPADDVDLLLRADGTDYSLTEGPDGLEFDPSKPWLFQSRETRWLSVAGQPTDVQVVLRVGDVEQVVDAASGKVDLGDAAALADVPALNQDYDQFPCGSFTRTDSGADLQPGAAPCTVSSTLRTPYVDGLGWADTGQEFLVVNVRTAKQLALSGESPAAVTERAATLDGADPIDTWQRDRSSTQFVFEVPEGEQGDLTLTSSFGEQGKDPVATLEWSIDAAKLG